MKEITCPKCHTTFTINEEEFKSIRSQLRDQEFNDELAKREKEFEQRKREAVKATEEKANLIWQKEIAEKEKEIISLTDEIKTKKTEQELAVKKTVAETAEELNRKTVEIEQLKAQLDSQKKAAEMEQVNIKNSYMLQLKYKDDEIEQLKDFKAKQSTKMVGESLEVFCSNEFEKIRAVGFQSATFEKDNKVSETGSKGDFIFRDKEDGVEYVSIMFEMKHETGSSSAKHKNKDFFKELDKDRKEKNCEYAVLVSTLEPDNDVYNAGIVDVSHEYKKMYVVRPQFFIPIITLLRNAARNSLQYQKELVAVRNQNIDISNFEAQLIEFKQRFDNDCRMAGNSFQNAIDDIDKTIKKLETIKNNLQLTVKHMAQGNKKLQDITVKKLVKNNPTMAAKFEELKKKQDVVEE